uniref:Uncharacterized protein n=1 Tax=Plectus sambesii TaxID=2011161 RepID=A0A914XSB0_9BILA
MTTIEERDRKFVRYLTILENKITKRKELTAAQLMDIVYLAQESSERMALMTEREKGTLLSLIRNRLNEFSTQDLMTVVAFGGEHATVLLADWERAMTERLEPDQLLSILQIYVDMNIDMPRQLFERWEATANKSQVVQRWSADDTTLVIERMAALRLRPNDAFLKRWVERFEYHSAKFTAHQLAVIVCSVGTLRINDAVFEKLLHGLIADWEMNQIRKMNATDLLITMKGLARLDVKPQLSSETFTTFWFDEVGAKIKRLEPTFIVAIGCHLTKLKIDPPTDADFVDRWMNVVASNVTNFGAGELVMALDGCLYFGIVGPAITFIDGWINTAESVMEKIWSQELACLLIKLHQLKILPDERFFG